MDGRLNKCFIIKHVLICHQAGTEIKQVERETARGKARQTGNVEADRKLDRQTGSLKAARNACY